MHRVEATCGPRKEREMKSRLWKLPSELTQHEMDVALHSLECGYGGPPVAERYEGSRETCRIDFWFHRRDQARSHHFEAEFERLADAGDLPIVGLDIQVDGIRRRWIDRVIHPDRAQVSSGPSDANPIGLSNRDVRYLKIGQVQLVRQHEHGPIDAMFIVVGQIAQEGKWMDIVSLPGVGSPIYSVVRLVSLDEIPVIFADLLPGTTFLGPIIGEIDYGEMNPLWIFGTTGCREIAGELPRELTELMVQLYEAEIRRVEQTERWGA